MSLITKTNSCLKKNPTRSSGFIPYPELFSWSFFVGFISGTRQGSVREDNVLIHCQRNSLEEKKKKRVHLEFIGQYGLLSFNWNLLHGDVHSYACNHALAQIFIYAYVNSHAFGSTAF